MRAATVARREGKVTEFSLTAFRAMHLDRRDLTERSELVATCSEAGLDPEHVLTEIRQQDVKDELRAVTEEAHARGVPGVPTVIVGEQVFWGDDRLDEAAAARGQG
jgi:2-hydroxychromene-2-carboxylate isomerase